MLGSPGPDQGYVVHLTDTIAGTLTLGHHEHEVDAMAAIQAVALKRASLYGRAPVIHDVQAAVVALGFDKPAPTGDAGERRSALLEECHHPHFYLRLRSIADLVPAEALERPVNDIKSAGVVAAW